MNIKSLESYKHTVPLKKPFKTALRTVMNLETIIVHMTLEDGTVGYGEAVPTPVITGETIESIESSILHILKPQIIGQSITEYEQLFTRLNKSLVNNTSAKAAVDMAIYDCVSQLANLPLIEFLGGKKKSIRTDFTVSIKPPNDMAHDAQQLVQDGFQSLKIKVGQGQIQQDIERLKAIRESVGEHIILRLDANQGWNVKDAIYAINEMERLGLNIELVEQPVMANDLKGLQQVTQHTHTPIMADESVFSLYDARLVLEQRAADLINLKLMKTGGIHEALKIIHLAEAFNVECMIGSMIETKLGITAAAHLASSQPNVTRYDFDAPLMLKYDLIEGGIQYQQDKIIFSNDVGLGINNIKRGSQFV
ncbi:dipeptide epimerase [Aquisalibacillus elongatus]|uniref:Dipeptide epimerase n=1 Tax=Aquisalibacillus elongatus TaxID=485577 RepID=A0A3N5BUW0_9BACI|nr:dipeptide epimerase [Aquisalibacillus elongatus]RPF51162.1 o-succinylbenzoate synthase/o-succinylbenzoate synthase,TIGR01928 [Aquisalibacillus elongatus]